MTLVVSGSSALRLTRYSMTAGGWTSEEAKAAGEPPLLGLRSRIARALSESRSIPLARRSFVARQPRECELPRIPALASSPTRRSIDLDPVAGA